MYVGVMFVWDVCEDRDHIVPLLLLDILRGRKVWEEEGEEGESGGLAYVCAGQLDREMAEGEEESG